MPTASRPAALTDLFLVIAVLVGVKQALLPYSTLYAGPASTLSAMILATFLLRRRGSSWAALGLRRPESWKRTLGLTVLVFVLMLLTAAGARGVAELFFEDIGTSGRFDFVVGNLAGYLLIMVLVWTHSAFFEELLFRAFIITKGSEAMGKGRLAMGAAVVLAAIFFGYRHFYYQGMHGALITGAIGLTFGIYYVVSGRRNIWPLILAHGLVNSIGQTSRFLG